MKYEYVGLENQWMLLAYNTAKALYQIKKWNKKTTPVAVIVSKSGQYLAHAACSNGLHPIKGTCKRLNKPGSDYSECPACQEQNHAERLALLQCYDLDLTGAIVYLYGHYHLCKSCLKALADRGVNDIVLLENCEVLFDRHNSDTVINKKNQFDI